jgi:hypothetical protein
VRATHEPTSRGETGFAGFHDKRMRLCYMYRSPRRVCVESQAS